MTLTAAALPVLVAAGAILAPAPPTASALPPATGCAAGERVRLARPASGAYHAAFPNLAGYENEVTEEILDRFENLAGKSLAGVYVSNHWGKAGKVRIRFPRAAVRQTWNHGAVPLVRWMPWTTRWRRPDPQISMQRIIDGRYDGRMERWLRAAKETAVPMTVEIGTEVNGSWFPWNGKWNGGGETRGYGKPGYPDGPERFRDAYRRIIDLSRRPRVGANNITWVFHPDAGSVPETWWNTMGYYYPGDGYIDWLFISAYGEQVPTGKPGNWETLREVLGRPSRDASPYAQFVALSPSKPRALIEFGVTEDPGAGDKAAWITEALDSVSGGHYDFQMESYWSERWANGGGVVSDLRINSSPEALAAYRAAVANSFFETAPVFDCG